MTLMSDSEQHVGRKPDLRCSRDMKMHLSLKRTQAEGRNHVSVLPCSGQVWSPYCRSSASQRTSALGIFQLIA